MNKYIELQKEVKFNIMFLNDKFKDHPLPTATMDYKDIKLHFIRVDEKWQWFIPEDQIDKISSIIISEHSSSINGIH